MVSPPVPDEIPADGWVQIANPSHEAARKAEGRLIISLYEIEPDPHLRNVRALPRDGVYTDAPLPLSLHYMLTYPSGAAEHRQQALGGVLRAFHTQSSLDPRDYLPQEESKSAQREGTIASAIQVQLETPDVEKLGHMWSSFGQGVELALFYKVNVAIIPSFIPRGAAAVGGFDPPSPGRMGAPR